MTEVFILHFLIHPWSGVALWMADLLKLFDVDGKIYTLDIDIENINPIVKQRKDIEIIQGDSMKIEENLTDSKMKV